MNIANRLLKIADELASKKLSAYEVGMEMAEGVWDLYRNGSDSERLIEAIDFGRTAELFYEPDIKDGWPEYWDEYQSDEVFAYDLRLGFVDYLEDKRKKERH